MGIVFRFHTWKRRPDRKGKVHLMADTGHRFCSPWTPSPTFTETVCPRDEVAQSLDKLQGQKLCRTCLKDIALDRQDRAIVYAEGV